jgi:hypothetical protein
MEKTRLKYRSYQGAACLISLLFMIGCGSGNGTGASSGVGSGSAVGNSAAQQRFGPLTLQLAGTPQRPFTSSSAGSMVTGEAGATYSTILLSAQPTDVLIGPTGRLGTMAGAFFYVTRDFAVTSIAAVNAFNEDEVRITPVPSVSDPSELLLNVTAPHGVSLFSYINGLSGTTNILIRDNASGPDSGPYLAVGFQVVINATTGTVLGVRNIQLVPLSTLLN